MTETPIDPTITNDRRSFLSRAALGGAAAAALVLPAFTGVESANASPKSKPTKKDDRGTREVYNVLDYGAKGNGKADDTKKIQKAINAAQSAGGGTVYLPPGTYKTTATLVVSKSRVNIQGDGASSNIACSFAAGDILRVARPGGTGPLLSEGIYSDFAITSSIVKTSGAALAMDGVQDMRISNIGAVSRVHPNNLYDAFTFHDFTIVVVESCTLMARNKGVTCWGNEVGADIWLTGGTLLVGTPVGVHLGGGVGGVYFNDFLCFQNGANIVIDDTLAGTPNREVFFEEAILDGAWRHNVEIMENGVYIVGFMNTWFSNGGFSTSGHPDGAQLRVHPGAILHPTSVIVSGCKFFNGYGTAIHAESGTWTITGSDISLNGQGANGGYGVLLSGQASQSVINGNTIRGNGTYPEDRPLGVGIKIDAGVDNYVVVSNLLTSNATAALIDEGGPSKIVDQNLGV